MNGIYEIVFVQPIGKVCRNKHIADDMEDAVKQVNNLNRIEAVINFRDGYYAILLIPVAKVGVTP